MSKPKSVREPKNSIFINLVGFGGRLQPKLNRNFPLLQRPNIHTYTHARTHTPHTHIHIYIHTYVRKYIYKYIYISMCKNISVYVYLQI